MTSRDLRGAVTSTVSRGMGDGPKRMKEFGQ